MSMFLCVIDRGGSSVTEELRQRYAQLREARTVEAATWCSHGAFAALVGSDVPGIAPPVVQRPPWVAVGLVRLDNRAEIASHFSRATSSDMAIILEAISVLGVDALTDFVGDFSFVAYNTATRTAIAARDPFGVRRLYMCQTPRSIAFSTRASLLTEGSIIDPEFLAEYLVNGYGGAQRTTFPDVSSLRAAEVVTCSDGSVRRSIYWELPQNQSAPRDRSEAIDRVRTHLLHAVRCRLTREPNVWAHLSGGMDSSSIVSVAQHLASRGDTPLGVAGAITYVTTPEVGADASFARMVIQQSRVRHECLGDWWSWQDDDRGVPIMDQPSTAHATYAVDRRLTGIVRGSSGSILLCGIGADLYFRPQLDSAADMLACGEVARALASISLWAGIARTSFWQMAFRHGALPLLPPPARRAFARASWRPPSWLDSSFVRRLEVHRRTWATRLYEGPRGRRARASQINRLLTQDAVFPPERVGEVNLEWRYPYLHRPLVEYALSVPVEWHVGGGRSKWLLREAMRGILPEAVRLRRGKGGLRPQTATALMREADRLAPMIESSLLSQLGCVHPRRLAAAIRRSNELPLHDLVPIGNALAIELWLRKREDWWS